MVNFYRPSWIEIDLKALSFNLNQIKGFFPQGVYVLAVVKADAYGLGITEVSKYLHGLGVNYLGVANLDEAVLLRKEGIITPILVLGKVPSLDLPIASFYNISVSAVSLQHAKDISLASIGSDIELTVHLKVDTAMHRFGVDVKEAGDAMSFLSAAPKIKVEGIFSHLPCADENRSLTVSQIRSFKGLVLFLKRKGFSFELVHISNSAGLVYKKEFADFCNMIRPGIALYGSYPSTEFKNILKLRPVMSLFSTVQLLRKVKKGDGVGYGYEFIASRDSLIGVVPIGYGDGYPRIVSGRARVLVRGREMKVVGRICMDYLFLDLTDLAGEVKEGDEVVLIGMQGGNEIYSDDLASWASTISYEVLCQMGRRLPRVFSEKKSLITHPRRIRIKGLGQNERPFTGKRPVSSNLRMGAKNVSRRS